MNKPIIIDDVDVSECEFYTDRLFIDCKQGCSAYARDCTSEYSKNCYYKQLQRLKAENEELNRENETWREQVEKWKEICDVWMDLANNRKQALEYVREILGTNCCFEELQTNDKNINKIYKAIKVINEVLKDEIK